MPNEKRTKALFRCIWAYSNGQPAVSYELKQDDLYGDDAICAIRDAELALKVAVVRSRSSRGFDTLAVAYERFLADGEESDDIEWVGPEET